MTTSLLVVILIFLVFDFIRERQVRELFSLLDRQRSIIEKLTNLYCDRVNQ